MAHAETVSVTAIAIAAASHRTGRRARAERRTLAAPMDLTCVLPSPICNGYDGIPRSWVTSQETSASAGQLQRDRHRLKSQQRVDIGIDALARRADGVHGQK